MYGYMREKEKVPLANTETRSQTYIFNREKITLEKESIARAVNLVGDLAHDLQNGYAKGGDDRERTAIKH